MNEEEKDMTMEIMIKMVIQLAKDSKDIDELVEKLNHLLEDVED